MEQEVHFDALFRAARTINTEAVLATGADPVKNGIIWDAGVEVGINSIPSGLAQKHNIKFIGLFTKSLGIGTALKIDWSALTPNDRLGPEGIPRTFYRMDMVGCTIVGENSDFEFSGWHTGVILHKPWSIILSGNSILGFSTPNALLAADFPSNSVGVLIENAGESSDVRFYDNRVGGFLSSYIINNVEAIRFVGDDVQRCFYGPIITNPTRLLNQVYLSYCHYSVSGPGFTLDRVNQVSIVGSQFDYRQGRTDTDTIYLLKLGSTMRSVITGNTFRAGASGSIVAHGIEFEETDSLTPVPPVDHIIVGNKFEDLNGSRYSIAGDPSRINRITDFGNIAINAPSFSSHIYADEGPFLIPSAGNNGQVETVLDTGSNPNGTWTRYTSGRLICEHVQSAAADGVIGSGFRTATDQFWDFPFPYKAGTKPMITGQVDSINGWIASRTLNNTRAIWRRFNFTSDATSRDVTLRAEGVWK